ncbi:prophage tail fiber N-terminal domain-containing protein [Escherichia coli]|uniref:prophage tail fiber N-terminal domain-containing protein n=1 Tax=Escherichia coli TaxID=562 RepID=UPI0004D8FB06|nr:prophage tail fiber N-terminal domain-containing protein [Escherichia coli]KDZ42422.1 prophage tail fiber N-terminal family protein [Escherichia coli 3-020-07_S4_C3]KDZ46201.1 prophage tail fiber N-terminal family protein [Escherichia coli 3-020-07_S4_C2]
MTVKISGVLKDGTGKPVQNCTIVLKARRTSSTVVVNTVASENPDEAGRYSMDVEHGQYSVTLLVEGFPPSHAGTITVYEDSRPGTLNDFLGAMTEDDARPEALRRFELMVEEVARNASAVAQNTAAAKKSASDASISASEAAIASTAYVMAAIAALVDSSPDALNTLNELAAALGNDPNFATTMTSALAGKQPKDATLTALAGLATAADRFPYFTGNDVASLATLTKVGRDILAKSTVAAVIEYLGLRELGTSGEKIPLLSTANTWTNRQTFSGGLSGELSGNASTAAKLKTARKISNVVFDGSSDITLKASHVGAFALGKTGSTVANDKAVGWNWSSGAYNATISGASTLIIHFYMGEGSCPAAQFRINYKNGGIFYRSARDGYGFEADWSEFYTTTRKPSAGDVGALPLSGGQLNGALGIGTSSALGGNSIVLGDNDTGFKQNGDGNLDVYANNVHVMRFVSGSIQSNKTINITGRVNPSDYGNFDSRYVKDVRLGSQQYYGVNNWQTWNFQCPSGHVLSGINVQDTGSNSADNIAGVYYRPVQKYINGTWYNVASV